MGKSGCGKSTLLNLLSGFLKPITGSIFIENNTNIGLFFQDYKLFDFLNVEQNISFPLILKGISKKKASRITNSLLKKFNLLHLKKKSVKKLSGGEKARVALLRMRNCETDIYLIDEATGELDTQNGEFIMKTIKELSKDKIIIFVTHNKQLAYKYGDHIFTLENKTLKGEINIVTFTKKTEVNKKRKNKIINFFQSIFFNLCMIKNRLIRIIFSSFFVGISFAILSITLFLKLSSNDFSKNIYNNFPNSNIATIYKTETKNLTNQVTIEETGTLSENEKNEIKNKYNDVHFYEDLTIFLPEQITVLYKDEYVNINLLPIINKQDDLRFVKANKLFYKTFNDDIKLVKAEYSRKFVYLEKEYIFNFNYTFEVDDYFDDIPLLNIPTIYYNYNLMKNYLYNKNIDDDSNIKVQDVLNDYNFKKNYINQELIISENLYKIKNENINNNITINSYPFTIAESFDDLINSITSLISIFLVVVLIITFFLEYISIFFLYEENKNYYAIVLAYDTNEKSYKRILLNLVYIFFGISTMFYSSMFLIFNKILNSILFKIDLSKFVYFNFNVLIFSICIFLILIFSMIASYFSYKKINKSELLLSLRKE